MTSVFSMHADNQHSHRLTAWQKCGPLSNYFGLSCSCLTDPYLLTSLLVHRSIDWSINPLRVWKITVNWMTSDLDMHHLNLPWCYLGQVQRSSHRIKCQLINQSKIYIAKADGAVQSEGFLGLMKRLNYKLDAFNIYNKNMQNVKVIKQHTSWKTYFTYKFRSWWTHCHHYCIVSWDWGITSKSPRRIAHLHISVAGGCCIQRWNCQQNN